MTTFEAKLIELKEEQIRLLSSPDRRKKVVRTRIQEITAEFYATKEEWRKFDEANKTGIYAFL